jgi:hypothetical protein
MPPSNSEKGDNGRESSSYSSLLLDDSLGKLVLESTAEARRHPTFEDYLLAFRTRSDLHAKVHHLHTPLSNYYTR